MKSRYSVWIVAALLIISLGFNVWQALKPPSSSPELTSSESSQQLYTCGMHPNVIQEGPGTCPICGNADWGLNPGLAAPAILNADGTDTPLGGEPVAQVVFFYHNSGSLRLFSAMVMGLTSADERSHGEHRWVTCSPTPCPR